MSKSAIDTKRIELENKIRVAFENELQIKLIYPGMDDFAPNLNHGLLRLLEQRKKLAESYFSNSSKDESAQKVMLELFDRVNEQIKQAIGL